MRLTPPSTCWHWYFQRPSASCSATFQPGGRRAWTRSKRCDTSNACALSNWGIRRRLDVFQNMEFKPEDATGTRFTGRAHLAAHRFDQVLAHHQTDAGALYTAVFLAQAIERVKQLVLFFRR